VWTALAIVARLCWQQKRAVGTNIPSASRQTLTKASVGN